jgi:hypothetical protein
MRYTNWCASLLGLALFLTMAVVPAQAQATRTWVSGVGDDANPCSRTAPCKTFAGAISKTATGGEIDCLDPGGFGAVTITKSITLDCQSTLGSILASGTNGININIASGVVRLRNLSITGAPPAAPGIHGINILNAADVFVENVLITDFSQFGIRDNRATSGKLYVKNTTIRNNGGSGIGLFASSGFVEAVIDSSDLHLNNIGLGVANANRAMLSRSVLSGNVTAGVALDPGGIAVLESNVISSNTTGLTAGAGSTVLLSNNDFFLNGTAISGTTLSFRTNRIQPGGAGTTPTALGAAQSAFGQQ